jgi:hypothetical protein
MMNPPGMGMVPALVHSPGLNDPEIEGTVLAHTLCTEAIGIPF